MMNVYQFWTPNTAQSPSNDVGKIIWIRFEL